MFEYRRLTTERDFSLLYRKLVADNLLWVIFPNIAADYWTEDRFIQCFDVSKKYTLGGFVDGELAGTLEIAPFHELNSQCGEIGLLAFRKYFSIAPRLSLGGFDYILKFMDVKSFVGFTPCKNHHVLRLLESQGFKKTATFEGMFWFAKLNKFVDGVMVTATPESILKKVHEYE